MGYLPKKAVLNGIKSRSIRHGDEHYTIFEAYLGTDALTKKPVRKAAKTKAQLEAKIEKFYRTLSTSGEAAVRLTPFQAADARNALDMLARQGLSLTLTECVRRIAERPEEQRRCETTLMDAYAKYCETQADRSKEHRKSIRGRVGKWVESFGGNRLLSEVTAQEVNADLEKRVYVPADPKTKTTYNNHLNYIKTFLNWCAAPEQGYIERSPIAAMKPKTKEWVDPEYMPAENVRKLFAALERHKEEAPADLADAILSFFCGMRQAEIGRVRDGEGAVRISLENKNIRVVKCKGASKGIKPRSFTIPPTALAWMQSFDFMSAVMQRNGKFREHLVVRAKEAGIALPGNAGRHTFITMHAAAYHDQNLLTSIVGNTDEVRSDHYDGLTFEDEGKAYFAIMPTSSCA